MKPQNSISGLGSLLREIKVIITKARNNSFYSVNQEMLRAYFEIGKKIVLQEQKGQKRAEYGSKLLEILSLELQKEIGKGFDASNLRKMRTFYLTYQKWETVSPNLTWSHYCELIKIGDPIKRLYFEKYVAQENLSVRNFKRQIYSLHYERLLSSQNKQQLIAQENKLFSKPTVEEVIKDPYILDFLKLDEKPEYTEKQLETRLLNDLQKFLLELGQGFSFVSRQKRFTIDNDHFYIDLLFYNIYLKCYVVIELKVGKFKHEYAGQMNFYLNFVRKELNKAGDNEPVGIILCTEKDGIQVEYAISGLSNKLFVSKYRLYLPSKEELERELQKLI